MIRKIIGTDPYHYIEDVDGSGSFVGLKAHVPSTPAGTIELYILEDIMVISSKVKMFWLYNLHEFPLILLRPGHYTQRVHPRSVYIEKYNIIGSRINMDFKIGASKVNYSLYLRKVESKKDIEFFNNWFKESNKQKLKKN